MDDRTAALIRDFPVGQKVSVREAAQLLGGPQRVADVMMNVSDGEIVAWTHSPAGGPLVVSTDQWGSSRELPRITVETDPALVFVARDDVIWMWCVEYEIRLQGCDLPSKDSVERRLAEVFRLRRESSCPRELPQAPPKPVGRMHAVEEGILHALREAGFDPLSLPPRPAGLKYPPKQAAFAALTPCFTRHSIEGGWKRLLQDDKLKGS